MYDFEKLFQNYSQPYWTEGNNVSEGWVNIQCPFCDDSSNHGGFNISSGKYSCWRCGSHPTWQAIQKAIGVDWESIKDEYKTNSLHSTKFNAPIRTIPTELHLPIGTKPITEAHKNYLIKRNFVPEKIERLYKIQGTGPVGEWSFRIIIPIFYQGSLVSYQGRDYSGKSDLRYKTCKKELEIRSLKHCLYALDLATGSDVVVVEGVFDQWRLGPGAVAAFGITVTQAQINLLARFETVFILFDPEEHAQERAEKLAWAVGGLGAKTEILLLKSGDPAELSQEEADYLMKNLKKIKNYTHLP